MQVRELLAGCGAIAGFVTKVADRNCQLSHNANYPPPPIEPPPSPPSGLDLPANHATPRLSVFSAHAV